MRSESTDRFSLFSLLVLAGILLLGPPGRAESTQAPPASTAPPQTVSPPAPVVGNAPALVVVKAPQNTFLSGNNVPIIVAVLPETAWQPIDGTVKFTVEGNAVTADLLNVAVCFGWRESGKPGEVAQVPGKVAQAPGKVAQAQGEVAQVPGKVAQAQGEVAQAPGKVAQAQGEVAQVQGEVAQTPGEVAPVKWYFAPLRVLHMDPGKITYGATVPSGLGKERPPWTFPWSTWPHDGLGFVPLAQFRVLALANGAANGAMGCAKIGNDMQVGITVPGHAAFLVLVLTLGAWGVLYAWACQRKIRGGCVRRIITNGNGYTSLSQLQITLWTFVIAAGAVYVMALSGSLSMCRRRCLRFWAFRASRRWARCCPMLRPIGNRRAPAARTHCQRPS